MLIKFLYMKEVVYMPALIILLFIIFAIILFKVYSNNKNYDFETEENYEKRVPCTSEETFSEDVKGYTSEESNKVFTTSTEIRDFFDLEQLKRAHPNIDFDIDDFIANPYFNIQEKDYSLEHIEKLFNECVEYQAMGPCKTAIESYLSGNYISEKSIAFSQIFIKAAMLQYVTYGGWNYWDARDIAKAFICIFENAKRKSVQDIDTEINIAYSTIVELLTRAANTPFVKSMKEPLEVLKITQFLINLYCFCPTTIDEYIEELLSYLSHQKFPEDENNKKNDLISFFEKAQSNVFNSGYVDLKKFKAYNANEHKSPELDTVSIKYYNENEGTCIFDIDFIETPHSKIDIVVSVLDIEKHAIPFDTNSQDYEFHIPYENDSAYKCGMLRISKTIFGFPKQAKFLEVKLNSQNIICEFNINNSDDREFIIQDNILKKYIGHKTTIEIPTGIINVGEEAFKNCESIVSVQFRKAF